MDLKTTHNSGVLRVLHLDSGAKLGLHVRIWLPGFEADKPLGAGYITTNDYLFLHHKRLKITGGCMEHDLHYGCKTKYGLLSWLARWNMSANGAKSCACTKACAKMKQRRLLAFVDGYIVFVDAEKRDGEHEHSGQRTLHRVVEWDSSTKASCRMDSEKDEASQRTRMVKSRRANGTKRRCTAPVLMCTKKATCIADTGSTARCMDTAFWSTARAS